MARASSIGEQETLPEPDRLDGFPHPRATLRLDGQGRAEATFLEAFASGRPHHAWLLKGPAGIGKATLAYRIARFLLAEDHERDPFGQTLDVDREGQAARLVAQLAHPELLVIRRPWDFKGKKLKTEIPVDEVRRLRGFLHLQPGGSGWRVVIIDPADDLNTNAANALLKSLEEPPARTIFLLVAAHPQRLLATLRSRCRSLDCLPLGEEDLRRAVAQAMLAVDDDSASGIPTGAAWQALSGLAEGSVRRLLMLHTGGGLQLHDRISEGLAGLGNLDWARVHTLGDEIGSPVAEVQYELFFELLLRALAQMIRRNALMEADPGSHGASTVAMSEVRLAAWAQLWETVVADKAETDALNLDRKALIIRTFQRLSEASRAGA